MLLFQIHSLKSRRLKSIEHPQNYLTFQLDTPSIGKPSLIPGSLDLNGRAGDRRFQGDEGRVRAQSPLIIQENCGKCTFFWVTQL